MTESRSKTFTCAACEQKKTVRYGINGVPLSDMGTWSTHGFFAVGEFDRTVTVYTCSDACAKRVVTMPPPRIVNEALEWLGADDQAPEVSG